MQASTERVVIPVREMVRLGMRVSRGPHVLEIALYQGVFVSRQRSRVGMSGRTLARAQAERANRGAEKKEKAPVTQLRGY